MIYHIYSDYSRTESAASYAYAVVYYVDGIPHLHKFGSRRLKLLHPSHLGEMMGVLAGVRTIPDDCVAIAHSDIAALDNFLKSKKKRHRIFSRQKKETTKHRKRLRGLQFLYLGCNHRPPIHHWCHQKARTRIIENQKEPPDLKTLDQKQMIFYFGRKKKKKKHAKVA